ncbi:hypothetical protein BGZ46_001611 [Entomortierella lignicola]|nr:hypothetical protein BGZ46_001611 [Entomortierella lignicola]
MFMDDKALRTLCKSAEEGLVKDMHMHEADRDLLSLSPPSAVLSYSTTVIILLIALEDLDHGRGANSVSFCVIGAPSLSIAMVAMIRFDGTLKSLGQSLEDNLVNGYAHLRLLDRPDVALLVKPFSVEKNDQGKYLKRTTSDEISAIVDEELRVIIPLKREIISTDEELDWIRSSDSVSPGLYFEKFRSDSQNQYEEHQRYSRLLDNGNFEPDCINSLRKNFDSWKINNAQQFWLDRRTRAVTMRTAGKLVEGSEPVAFQSIDRTTSKILEQDQATTFANKPEITSTSKPSTESTSMSTSEPTGKLKTESPWHELTVVLDQIVNGKKNAVFPEHQGSSALHRCLFELAVASLKSYLEQPDQYLLKDAQVAMSCIFNTMSSRACEQFNKEDPMILQQAKSTDQGILNAQYLEVEMFLDKVKVEDKTLSCLIHLCENILNPPFGPETASEQDWMGIWAGLLHRIKDNSTFHT